MYDDTPEHRLWIRVLQLFLHEVVRARGNKKATWRVMRYAQSKWHEDICEMIGVDYGSYLENIRRILTSTKP